MTNTASQGLRYLLVGGFNTGFTLGVFWILDRLYSQTLGVQAVYWTAAFVGIANGFVWQRLLVWRSRNRWRAEFARFLAMNLAVSATNSLALYCAVSRAGFSPFASQVVITAALVALSFLLARSWVFRRRHRTDAGA
jgi:putative flippase GtrA